MIKVDFLGSPDFEKKFEEIKKNNFENLHKRASDSICIDTGEYMSKGMLNHIREVSEKIKENTIVIAGIGGSYLASKVLVDIFELNQKGSKREFHFVGTSFSSIEYDKVSRKLKGKNYHLVVISKSGTTLETSLAFKYFKEDARSITVISEKESELTKESLEDLELTEETSHNPALLPVKWYYIELPNYVGGRFSILTAAGLYVAALAGIDIGKIIEGSILDNSEEVLKYAIWRYIQYKQKNKKIECLATFHPLFESLGQWWQQLFAESEGKSGVGLFPVNLVYSRDLHSVGQMIQDGERNIIETLLCVKSLPIMTSIETLNSEVERATIKAHDEGGVPICKITISKIDEESVGELLIFFMKACICSATLLNVDPFTQPGVEAYKNNIKSSIVKSVLSEQGEDF